MVLDHAETYRKYAEEIVRFASALAGPSGAEDVVSNAMVRVLRVPDWPQMEHPRAYLYRVVLREAGRDRRATNRRLEREARVARLGPASVETTTIDPEVSRALRSLTVRQRAVVFLTYWSDLTATEVADRLALSTRTVERELAAAKRRLQEVLA